MIYSFFAVTLNIKEKLVELGDPYKVQNVGLLLSRFIGILLVAAAVAAFFYLIMGGIQWITSGGDKAGVTAAREKITAAFIGLAIVATAWAVFLIIQWFFGFRILGGPRVGPSGNGPTNGPSGDGAWVDCCEYQSPNKFNVPVCECKKARNDPTLRWCLSPRFTWYTYSEGTCRDQFTISEDCWRENFDQVQRLGCF